MSDFSPVLDMFLSLLTDHTTALGFKNQVLDLLPFFVSLRQEDVDKVIQSLNRLIADNFPLKAAEFVVGSLKYKDYIAAIDKVSLY